MVVKKAHIIKFTILTLLKCIFKYIHIVVPCLDLIFKFLFFHKFLVLFFPLDMKCRYSH